MRYLFTAKSFSSERNHTCGYYLPNTYLLPLQRLRNDTDLLFNVGTEE